MGDASTVPTAVFGVLLGLVVGSFLNVVVWRVPRGESVVRPPSHCPHCDHPVRQRDNVPVLSWLLLRGRCRDCGHPISRRYPAVEAATAVLFAAVAWRFGLDWQLPAFWYLAAIAVALALIDVDERRLPDAIVLPSYVVALVLLLVPTVAEGRWTDLLHALIGAAALFALYFAAAFAHPAGMGFGDVKLSGVLGLYLAWIGWGELVLGAFLGFLLGSVYGVALMASGRGGRKTTIPYGPFMLAGALLAVLAGAPVVDWYRHVVGL